MKTERKFPAAKPLATARKVSDLELSGERLLELEMDAGDRGMRSRQLGSLS